MGMLMELANRAFLAFILSLFWSFFHFVITYGLYRIKGKELPDGYTNSFSYAYITNCILIFICLLLFYRENT